MIESNSYNEFDNILSQMPLVDVYKLAKLGLVCYPILKEENLLDHLLERM